MLTSDHRLLLGGAPAGSAADVVMSSMLKVHLNPRLRELGWNMVLQVHDEIILEGPENSREEAFRLLLDDMQNPFDDIDLLVTMDVDAKIDTSWYKAK